MLLAGITVFGCPALLTAKPGDVDAQFHTGDGRLAWCMAQQPDGKWLVGCNYNYVAAGQTAIFRLLPDGGLDSGFNPPLFHSHVRCILVQPDGKILVGKEFNWRDGELHGSGLIRLLADGARDSSFHVNSTDSTWSLALQDDGKILAGGDLMVRDGDHARGGLVRLHGDGTLDADFDAGFVPVIEPITSIAVQPDGRILAAGRFSVIHGASRSGVARLRGDGSLDETFNPDFDGWTAQSAVCLSLNPDGKILVGGIFQSESGAARRGIGRLLPDGSADPHFNPEVPDRLVNSITESADGKIIIGLSSAWNGQDPGPQVLRLNADGSRDTQFIQNTGHPINQVFGLSMQPDGKVTASGTRPAEPGKSGNFLIRLENDPAIQALSAPAFNRVQWLRGGSSPGTSTVDFDFSTDGGLNWKSLGKGVKISGGWELAGPGLPGSGLLRARAPVTGGWYNGSSGLVETVRPFAGFAVPEMAVMGNGREIASGDQSPEAADHTDFGQVDAGNGILERTFTILNRGSALLTLRKTPAVRVEGSDAPDFTVISQAPSTVATGAGAPFTVRFDPRALGVRTAVISIDSDDADEGGYQFSLQGTGVGLVPEVAVFGNGVDIATEDSTPSPEDHTDFGKVGTVGGSMVRTFTIQNSGTGVLRMTGPSMISVSGPQAVDFTVVSQPRITVPPGESTAFQITFLPSAPGLRQATVRVSSDDENEGDFHFAVQGSGRFPGEVRTELPAVPGSDIRTMAVQGDGKILIGTPGSPYLIRLQADGTPDTDFKTSLYSPDKEAVTGITVQPDGKILVAGSFTKADEVPVPGITRLLPDGTLDRTFQSAASGGVVGMAVRPDGKIMLGGTLRVGGAARSLVRLDAGGMPDPAFEFDHIVPGLACLALMENGKIMLGGEFTTVGDVPKKGIARLNADGALDLDFDAVPNGVKVLCMAPQADGKLIITGAFSQVNGIPCDGIARLLSDGSVDRDYQGDLEGSGPWVSSLALQTDGGLVLGGEFTEMSGVPRLNVARLAGDGALDTGFNPVVNTFVDFVQVQADGGILLGGGTRAWQGTRRPGLTRLENTAPGHSLTVSGYNRMRWMRSGTSPEASGTVFEASADNGVTWRMLGAGVKINGGWELNGPGLPSAGLLRASALTVSSAVRASNGIAVETTTFQGLVKPGMTLTGNGVGIQNGDTIPDLADHSDFGPAPVRGGLAGRSFTIHNTGPVTLNLLGEFPITMTGDAAAEFKVAALPSRAVAAGGNLTFEVSFDPAALGLRTAVAHIASDDFSGADFTFTIQGMGSGLASEISVTGNETEILSGDSNPSAADHTDFGITRSAVDKVTRTFMIVNNGTTELILTGVRISGPQAAEFTVTAPPPEKVPVNGTAIFQVTFDPTGIASRKAVVEVTSDDDDERVFSFAIQGTGWAPGDLDPDFQTSPNHLVSSLGLQSDGRILIGGQFSYISQWAGTQPDQLHQFPAKGLAWLLEDGALNTARKVNFSDGANIYCTARQHDGRLLVGGFFIGAGSGHLVRLNEDGTPDKTFLARLNGLCRSLAVMPDGKIVICGEFTSVGGLPKAGLARLNADGSPDTAFDPRATGTVLCALRQADGKILFGGVFSTVAGVQRSQIARLNADGTLDPDFAPGIPDGSIRCMALQADGKILVGGAFSRVNAVNRFSIARLNPDGTLDTAFDPNCRGDIRSMAVQTDGRIVVAGEFTQIGGAARSGLARLNADGTLEVDFNTGVNDTVRGVLIDSRGRIIIGGEFSTVDGIKRSRLARLDNDPAPQELQTMDGSRARWLRGGASAETHEVSFDLSTDGAATWIPLGTASRIPDGWELTGLTLPSTGKIRARARIHGGYYNGSSSLLETVAEIGGQNRPQMTVEHTLGPALENGAGGFDFGTVTVGERRSTKTFTLINRGSMPLYVDNISLEGANKTGFILGETQATAFSVPGLSTTVIEVHFSPTSGGAREAQLRISSNAGQGLNPFLINLSGRGNTAPLFHGYTLRTFKNTPMILDADAIRARTHDREGDEVNVSFHLVTTFMGGTLSYEDNAVIYHPPSGYTGLDLFEFAIQDSLNGYTKGLITVRVNGNDDSPPMNTLELVRPPYGPAGLLFQGVSSRTYQLQRSADLESWTILGTSISSEDGSVPFTDWNPLAGKAFYRVMQP